MFTTRFKTLARVAVLATSIGTAVLGLSGVAAADQLTVADAAYLRALDAQGITYPSTDYAIGVARSVCRQLGSGATALEVGNQIKQQNPKLTDLNLGFVVGASVTAYCPQYRGKLA